MRIEKFILVILAIIVGVSASAQEREKSSRKDEPMTDSGLPRKVENVTIKDLYGNPATLPYWGEKHLLIF